MTMISLGAGRRRSQGMAGRFRLWMSEAADRQRERRRSKDISHLSEHLLRDIGLEQLAQARDPAHWSHWR